MVTSETRAAIARRDAEAKALGPGPVYQGVCKAIRRAEASGKYKDLPQIIDPDEYAGHIALGRSLARAVDRLTGHNPTGWVANGRDVAPLAEQLRETLDAIGADDDDATDPLVAWLTDEDAPIEATP